MLKFGIHPGQEKLPHNCLANGAELSTKGNVVIILYREIPWIKNLNYILTNFILQLLKCLADKDILYFGTMHKNRNPGCKLPTDKQIKEQLWGTVLWYVANCAGTKICTFATVEGGVLSAAHLYLI